MKRAITLFLLLAFFLFPLPRAYSKGINCIDRYVTLINPVRSSSLWDSSDINHLKKQYQKVKQMDLSATWLLQDDVLPNKQILEEIKSFDNKQEFGIFMEVSEGLAGKSRVIYPPQTPWFYPNAVFLSGYAQSDRIKLIDRTFKDFKDEFGYYPKSAGAWWIDSYSLKYLKDKYNLSSFLIVADQKTTDNYGVWGQWWGVPYYPSLANVLVPSDNSKNQLDIVILQWAQRHPELALGEGKEYSNNSLQANDYISLGKNTKFFEEIARNYLDCSLPIGQITVGMETGMSFLDEYENQLKFIKENNIEAVTMSQFAQIYADKFKGNPSKLQVGDVWELTSESRINKKNGVTINYLQGLAFSDYFIADRANFLDRVLPLEGTKASVDSQFLIFGLLILLGVISFFKKITSYWLFFSAFCLSAFGPVLISFYKYGWVVYFGPVLKGLVLWQLSIILAAAFITYLLKSKMSLQKMWLLILPFGFDPIVKALRYSYISNEHYLGFAADQLRFIGVKFSKPLAFTFANQDLPAYQSIALLKLDFNKLFWSDPISALVIFPILHIGLGVLLVLVFKYIPPTLRKIILIALGSLFIYNVFGQFYSDPVFVSKL